MNLTKPNEKHQCSGCEFVYEDCGVDYCRCDFMSEPSNGTYGKPCKRIQSCNKPAFNKALCSPIPKIEGKELNHKQNYLDRVTYVPNHVDGNAGHADCEPGVIISFDESKVKVLFSKSRTVQITDPRNLVWG